MSLSTVQRGASKLNGAARGQSVICAARVEASLQQVRR